MQSTNDTPELESRTLPSGSRAKARWQYKDGQVKDYVSILKGNEVRVEIMTEKWVGIQLRRLRAGQPLMDSFRNFGS